MARSPACSACLLVRVLNSSQPDRTCPAPRPHQRDARLSRFLEGHSSGPAQEPGETRPSPNFVPGHWTMPCGHWPFRSRGGVLPVLRDSDSKWREHDEQVNGRVAAVVRGVRMFCGLRVAGALSFTCCWKRRSVGPPLVGGEMYSGLFL